MSTEFGAVEEYPNNGEDGYIVKNDDKAFGDKLLDVDRNHSKESLAEMGARLNQYFKKNYSWDEIGRKLVTEVYTQQRI